MIKYLLKEPTNVHHGFRYVIIHADVDAALLSPQAFLTAFAQAFFEWSITESYKRFEKKWFHGSTPTFFLCHISGGG